MYKVLFVFTNEKLLSDIQSLDIWDSGIEAATVNSGKAAYEELKKQRYDLCLTQTELGGSRNGLWLLKAVKKDGLCPHVVFCSAEPDFEYARQGIIFGAFDYIVEPFTDSAFRSIFERIGSEVREAVVNKTNYTERIAELFRNRDSGIREYISEMLENIYNGTSNNADAEEFAEQVFEDIVNELFERNEWLDLYVTREDFVVEAGLCDGDSSVYKRYYSDKMIEFFEIFCGLYPKVHNEKIKEVILYILNNPESDLKQKTIAEELYINSSYLSTVFVAQTELRFVDYLTTVKLTRAGWLLQNTTLKIVEIATRLDYKDIGYFSRVFKKQYGMTPSEYRIPNSYNYQI